MTEQEFIALLNDSKLECKMLYIVEQDGIGEYLERYDDDYEFSEEIQELEREVNTYEYDYTTGADNTAYREAHAALNQRKFAEYTASLELPAELAELEVVRAEWSGFDEAELVIFLPSLGYYAKAETYYTSYDGVGHDGWDDFKSVKAVDRMVRFYE